MADPRDSDALQASLLAINQVSASQQLAALERVFFDHQIEPMMLLIDQQARPDRPGSLRRSGETLGWLQPGPAARVPDDSLELLAQLWSGALLAAENEFRVDLGKLLTQGDLDTALVLLAEFVGVQAAGLYWRRAGHWEEVIRVGHSDADVVTWLETHSQQQPNSFQVQPRFVLQSLGPRYCDRCLVVIDKPAVSNGESVPNSQFWTWRDWAHLDAVAPIFALALERISTSSLLTTLINLEQMLLERRLPDIYSQVLQAAVREVPGSEAGSLLVYENGSFGYRAVAGYGQELLQICYHPEDVRDIWYGLGNEAWQRNQPRLMSRSQDNIEATSRRYASDVVDRVGKLGDIQANLCVPVSYQGQFLAYLNLDNLSNPAAFDRDAMETARIFGSHIGLILQRARLRGELEAQAQTDALSGLGNRRAFQIKMGEILAQARQDRGQVTLALLDLDGFKQINDSLGHATGDLVIRDVAQALTEAVSTNQFLFRWGGDEFALVFPELDRRQSYQALASYQAALAQASPPGFSLTASLGLATFPEDGLMLEELFQKADAEMYREKLARNSGDTQAH